MTRNTPLARWRFMVAVPLALATAFASGAPEGDAGHYRAGIGMMNKGLNDLAEAELRAYLRDNPDGAHALNARYSLAVCLVRLGRHADAAKELEGIGLNKDFEFAADALLLRAQCALALADDATAIRVLEQLLARFPEWNRLDSVSMLLGESLYRIGKFQEARETFASIVSRWPKSPLADRADLFGAMAESSLGNHAAAAERAATLRARSPEGEFAPNAALIEAQHSHRQGELSKAAKLYSIASTRGAGATRIEGLLGVAKTSRGMKDLPGAARALDDAGLLAPSDELRGWLTLEQCKLFFDQGKFAEALRTLKGIAQSNIDSLSADAALLSAKSEAALGEYEGAARRLGAAAARHGASGLAPDMLFERAAILSKSGDDEAALEAWDEWRSKFESHELLPDALGAQAWCAHRLGRFDLSLQLCQILAEGYPARREGESLLLLIAENEYAMNNFEASLTAYEDLLKHHPDGDHAWRAGVRSGLCLSKLGRDDSAEKVLLPLLARSASQDSALRRSAILTLGNAALARKDWKKGEEWFSMVPDDREARDEPPDAMLRLGVCVLRQGRAADAIPLFDRVIKSNPDSPQSLQARFERGQALLELERLDEARDAMEHVIAGDTGDKLLTPHALRHLASIASRQGRPADAAGILSKLGAAKGTEDNQLELGAAWLAANKYAEAEQAFLGFISSGQAREKIQEARVSLAVAINRQGRHADAIEALKQAEDLVSLPAELRATAHYERGLALRSLGRDPEATEAYRSVLKEKVTRLAPYAALDLAQIERKAGRDDEALRLAESCLTDIDQLEDSAAITLGERAAYLRGASLLRLSRHAEAASAAAEFMSKHPKSDLVPSVRLLRGESLLALGRAKEAAEEFSHAAASGSPPEMRRSALLRLADACAASQEWSRSEEASTAFLDEFADSELWFQAKFGQGWARENQGRHEAAMEAYREVVSRHQGPTAARAQFQIGECLYAQKEYEKAVAELLKTDLLFAYPEWSAAALYEAGRCLAELGRHDDAAGQFDDLAKRFPDTQWARLAGEKKKAKQPAAIPGRTRAID